MNENHGAPPDPVDRVQAPTIEARFTKRINFASHQNDVPVLRELILRNPTDCDLEGLTLSLTCEPPLFAPCTWHLERIPAGGELHPSDRRVQLAGGWLAELSERLRAEARFDLKQGETVLASVTHSLEALARNEWGGANSMPELLAAFVAPNDPAIAPLLRDASRRLEKQGKLGSLEAYQARSRERVWEMVAALWSAVAARHLTYAEPPASFERIGQKIRLPTQIISEGLATCLDSALLFAAAIEQIGLHAVVVFTRGHALAGAWLQPQSFATLVVDESMEVRKRIDLSELILFETTMVTGAKPHPFTAAIAEGVRQVSGAREAEFVYALDLHQARGRDITPLPSALGNPVVAEVEPQPEDAPPIETPPPLPAFDLDASEEPTPTTPAARLDRWKRSLLDLSKRNRLLNLRPSASAIPIFCPDPAALEDQLAKGRRLRLVTPPERQGERDHALYHLRTGDNLDEKFARDALERGEVVANVAKRDLEKGAIELYRKARADLEEGGANTLFLALGMLRWKAPGERTQAMYRAPLLLLPVKLERASAKSLPTLRNHEDDPVFNLTLLQMLRQDFEIEIPGLDGELPMDEHGVDVPKVWGVVRQRIRNVPGLEVVEEVVLSTFSFAKYLMWKDLADRTEVLKGNPFVEHIIDHPRNPYAQGADFIDQRDLDRRLQPRELLAPLNADSSQLVAIHASGGKGDFVIEGPPGTGKSETIANLIVHNLGLGRRVLFVSEKMAALEVVYRRLAAVGLGDYCLQLHSSKANKREVLVQLGAAWQQREPLDAESWERKAERLADVRTRLNGLVASLHAPGPGGVSAREAMGRSLRYADVHRYRLDWAQDPTAAGLAPTRAAREGLEEAAKQLGLQFAVLEAGDFEAFREVAATEWSFSFQQTLLQRAQALKQSAEALQSARELVVERLRLPGSGDTQGEVAALAAMAAALPVASRNDLSFSLAPDGDILLEGLERQAERLREYRLLRTRVGADYPDEWIASAAIADWRQAWAVGEKRWWPARHFARRALRKRMCAALGVDTSAPERDLDVLADLQRLRGDLDAAREGLPASGWRGLQTDDATLIAAVGAGRELRRQVGRLSGFGHDLIELRARLARTLEHGRDLLAEGEPAAEAARSLVEAQRVFASRLEEFRLAAQRSEPLAGDLAALIAATRALIERERRLRDWCRWTELARDARERGLGSLVSALEDGIVAPAEAVEAFRTAYAHWLVRPLIDQRPELQRFSKVAHEDLIHTFRALDREVASLTADYVRAKLSAGVPDRNARNAGSGFGLLARELQKKKQHIPVRRLVSEMGAALTTLTPCLMMSPLSVAQFLSAEQPPFDLVVFDEASQITVPDAIGVIARGMRCIIVGDPKQMPPTRFFGRGPDEAEDHDEVQDLESILDEALSARVPLHRLTGHYRSKHESLIAFSNHAYYGGSLVTYPAAETRDSAVSLRRVNGVYAKGTTRTNPIEARALVAEVVRRLKDPQLHHLSLGVVTMNAEQQRLIEDLLDQERRSDPSLEPYFAGVEEGASQRLLEPVFVKNLETVQGDQRDVILLSIGYGPTEPGAQTMSMNFGPLNREGGERRLNVAVTRATTEMVVFASFDPGMIDLSRTKARAVADLKHYLDFAQRGPRAIAEAVRSVSLHDYDSDFELAVAEALRQHGWEVRTQVGVTKFRIDLAIVHPDAPGRFLAGIECDGATYHSSPTARDRDRVRQIILENLGWRLYRVWSTDFFVDAPREVDDLDAKLRKLLAEDRLKASTAPALPTEAVWNGVEGPPDGDLEDEEAETGPTEPLAAVDAEPTLTRVASLVAAPLVLAPVAAAEEATGPERFYDDEYLPTLREFAAGIIDREGPIHFRLLCERVARAHGFLRIGKVIKLRVWQVANRLRIHTLTPDEHDLFWPAGATPSDVIPYRGMGERTWADVPYPEKLGLVQRVRSQDKERTTRAVAAHAGIARVTDSFRREVMGLVDRLLLEGE